MFKLDHLAALITIAAIVALSLWPLEGHGGGDHEEDHGHAGCHVELHWEHNFSNFAACKAGRMQSMADISYANTKFAAVLPGHEFHFQKLLVDIFLGDHHVWPNHTPDRPT